MRLRPASSSSNTVTTISSLLVLFALPAYSIFSCDLDSSGIKYDLKPLSGVRTAVKESDTPPTVSEARAAFDLCAPAGLPRQDDVADEDQCPEGTRVCLTMLNHKKSASDPDRVTAVIPLWTVDPPDEHLRIKPQGKDGIDGVWIEVDGPDYAGSAKKVDLNLICDPSAKDSEPQFKSYDADTLTLSWSTPSACPLGSNPDSGTPSDGGGGSDSGSGMGFFGFIRFLFWLSVLGLIAYFAIGAFYNHQQYSARGWDLIPHRDFWREFPSLVQDLVSHVIAGLRGQSGGSRGGYSSLG